MPSFETLNFPVPADEKARLDALRRYEILDSAPEAIFDHVTRALAASLDVPTALISLVDENRQWFKSACGLDATETPRGIAFCAHAIMEDRPLIVPDATQDARFAANPLVAGPPFIRFYAGVPLRTAEGFNLGTLCIIDYRPRQPSEKEVGILSELARLVVDLFELRLRARHALRVEQTARRDAEQMTLEKSRQLTESHELFLQVSSLVPGVVYQFRIDPSGKMSFPYVSPSIKQLLGLDAQAVMADANLLLDIALPQDRPRLDASIVESHATLKPWNWEGRARNAEGEIKWIQGTSSPRRLDDGAVLWSGLILDQTLLHNTQEQLRQAQKMEAVGQLTGGVAHDFNNLLAVIRGNAELLGDSLEERNEHINAIERAVQRASDLTHRLLAFSRRQSLHPVSVDVGALIDGSLRLLRGSLGETVSLLPVVDPGCWQAFVDPGQLENAIVNLAINARDAMPNGGEVVISAANASLSAAAAAALAGTGEDEAIAAGDYVVVAVSDSGTGMTEAVRARAFEPFFTTKEVGKGSGLGLSMVYGFTRQSGGLATIESEPGVGTTIKLYLPRSAGAKERGAGANARNVPLGNGETVLLIEDDEAVRDLISAMLRSLGYVALSACDAREAEAVLSRPKGVDLILSDVVLPGGVSGPDFVTSLLPGNPKPAVVFMSGYPQSFLDKFTAQVSDDPGFLLKPFKREDLATALRKALAR